LTAGPSVADEKVTVLCEKIPLRDVMRQLSHPFGYTWLRSKKEGGQYRYELVQDLKSQLLEEELRNQDRNAALIDMEQEPERARNVIASLRDYHILRQGDSYEVGPAESVPEGAVPAAVPDAQPVVSLNLVRDELGQISLQGWSGFFIGTPPDDVKASLMGDGEKYIATGISPAVRNPRNAVSNAALASHPEMQRRGPRLDPGLPAAPRAPDDRTSAPDQSKIQNP